MSVRACVRVRVRACVCCVRVCVRARVCVNVDPNELSIVPSVYWRRRLVVRALSRLQQLPFRRYESFDYAQARALLLGALGPKRISYGALL